MRSAIITGLASLASLLIGWALPLVFPKVDAWVAQVALFGGVGLLIAAVSMWLGGRLSDGEKVGDRAAPPAPPIVMGEVTASNAGTREPERIDGGTFGSPKIDAGTFSDADIEFERGKRAAKRSLAKRGLSTEETTEGLGKAISAYRDSATGRFLTRSEATKEPKVFDVQVERLELKPDFPLANLLTMIKSINHLANVTDYDTRRAVGEKIMDAIYFHDLAVWARIGSQALKRLDAKTLERASLNVRDEVLEIHGTVLNRRDVHFCKLQVYPNKDAFKLT